MLERSAFREGNFKLSHYQADGYSDMLRLVLRTQPRSENIPKGLRHSAQRCRDEGAATLGGESPIEINSEGVVPTRPRATTPLGLMILLG